MKYKTLAVFGSNLLFCSTVYAFSLGNIEVNSNFREPLNAEITLFNTGAIEANSLKVNLAEDYAYLNSGIARNTVLDTLQLTLSKNESDHYTISITSAKPINELFLELILDVGTDTERLSRDYAILLDPKEYKLSKPVKVTKQKRDTVKKVAIKKTASHDMKGSVHESHSMESSIGDSSHDMKGSAHESHSMESSIGDSSHDMKGSAHESHSMESSIGDSSHDMKGSAHESHSMESSIGDSSHDMKGSAHESHSMESSIGDSSHDMKGSIH